MLRTTANVRTVWVKELHVEKRQGPNGEFDAKSILFRVATPRNYTRTVTRDGQQVEERPTDFILCRANGATAQVIADNCTAVDANGKHISRHLGLVGHIETYVSDRTFKVENLPLSIANVGTVNVSFDTTQKVDGHIFIVDEIEFLDPKPQPKVQAGGVTVSNVQVAPTQAQVTVQTQDTTQPVQTTTPVAPTVHVQTAAPVQTTPVTPVQDTANAPTATVQVATTQNTVAEAMNPPVVPDGYTGEASPF